MREPQIVETTMSGPRFFVPVRVIPNNAYNLLNPRYTLITAYAPVAQRERNAEIEETLIIV